jgi:signal transduction histidine kinase
MQTDRLGFGSERLADLVEALPVGVFILNGAGDAIYANAAAQALLGRGVMSGDRASNLGQRFAAVRAGTNDPYPTDEMPIVRALGGERTSIDDIEVLRGAHRVALEVTATPIVDGDGRVVFAVAVFQDITPRRQAQRALATLNEELERQVGQRTSELASTIVALEKANRAKSMFLMNVSHELRTPLNHIIGFSDLLCDRIDDPKNRKIAETAAAGGRELLDKVNSLIELARAEAEPATGGSVAFDGDALLREAAVPSSVRVDTGEPLGRLHGYAEAMRQIVHDVLQRAVAIASPEECAVSATVQRNGSRLVVRVTCPHLGARIRALASLFGETPPDDETRFRQQQIDFQLAVIRARCRVLGGDVTADGDDAIEILLPLD